jgi:hypothetical protein
MKIRLLTAVFVTVIFLSSCLEGSDNRTPYISMVHPVLTTGDTLYFTLSADSDEAGVYVMDTIFVGDTVQFYIFMDGFYNNLTAFYLKKEKDTSAVQIILPPIDSFDLIFTSASNFEKGEFLMNEGYAKLYFPFQYVALEPTNDVKLSISVVSDAKFDNVMGAGNSSTVKIKTPIKSKE